MLSSVLLYLWYIESGLFPETHLALFPAVLWVNSRLNVSVSTQEQEIGQEFRMRKLTDAVYKSISFFFFTVVIFLLKLLLLGSLCMV